MESDETLAVLADEAEGGRERRQGRSTRPGDLTAFQIADGSHGDTAALRQFLLGQPLFPPQTSEICGLIVRRAHRLSIWGRRPIGNFRSSFRSAFVVRPTPLVG